MVTPKPDPDENDWAFGIKARIGNEAFVPGEGDKSLKIPIVDAQVDISEIKLTADPASIDETVGIDGGTQDVTITAYVIGKAPTADIDIFLTAHDGNATRNFDYSVDFPEKLTIEKETLSGKVRISVAPVADGAGETKNETFMVGSTQVSKDDGKDFRAVTIGDDNIKVTSATITLIDKANPTPPEPKLLP